jgi:hypothetical protein
MGGLQEGTSFSSPLLAGWLAESKRFWAGIIHVSGHSTSRHLTTRSLCSPLRALRPRDNRVLFPFFRKKKNRRADTSFVASRDGAISVSAHHGLMLLLLLLLLPLLLLTGARVFTRVLLR